MCLYLILILPDDDAVSAARTLGELLGVQFGDAHVASPTKQLPAAARTVYATRGECDCGTPLGCQGHGDPDDDDHPFDSAERFERDLRKRLTKVRKEGWSDAKIARWEQQQRKARVDHARSDASRNDLPLSLDEWRSLLTSLLALPHVSEVSLFIHMFQGSRDDELIEIRSRQKHRLAALDDERMRSLEWDTLHSITR